jgi:hypothetical protein
VGKAPVSVRLFLTVLAFLTALTPTGVDAVEFAIVGPRAAGMGGAGVATTTDALATYWNPAGLAMSKNADIRVQGTGHGIDRLGVMDTLDDIDNFDRSDTSAANQARLQALADRLNQPGASLSAIAAGGAYFKGFFGNSAFGFNVSDIATGGVFLTSPVGVTNTGSTLNVNGQYAVRALEARQAAFSYAHAFFDRVLAIGVTAKIMQGAAYAGQIGVLNANSTSAFKDALGKAEISSAFGIDVGAVFRPTSWLRMGIVGKDLNEPTFDTPGGGEIKLGPQVRGGIAINPYSRSSLTLTFDADITSNRTLVPGQKSRYFSAGVEQTFFSELISLRFGALKNVEDAKSIVTPTAGIGIRIFALRVDVGGGYDFREGQALASGSVSMTF